MRSHLITLVALASSVVAQVPGIPDCAQSCLTGSYGGCQNIDPKCICSNTAYLAGLSCCVFQKCDAADQEKTIQFANSFCLGQGVTGLPQTASCAASQTQTTASSTSSPTSSVSVPASLSSSLASLGSSVAAQVSSSLSQNSSGGGGTTAPAAVTTTTPTGTATGASTGTLSAASSTSPGSGAQKTEVAGLGLAAVAGLLVLL